MNNKKTWSTIGVLILLSALLVAFFSLQPSPEDLLIETIDSMKTISDAHAVVEFDLDTPEQQQSGTVEIWGRKGEDGPGAFRLEVREASDEQYTGAIIVSDGETLWAYDPNVNNVLMGTAEEAKQMAEESDFFAEKFGEMGDFDQGDFNHPDTAEEAIQLLMEYFDVDNKGTETLGTDPAYRLEFVPIAEQMPTEFIAVGGLINMWIDKTRSLPVGFEYTGGTLGEVLVTVTSIEVNDGLDDEIFTFDIPSGAEIMGFDAIAPQSISLEDAVEAAEFQILSPTEIPEGATLVDILDVQGAIVQRYTWPDGGSFTIAQGTTTEAMSLPTEADPVELRGGIGSLYVDEDGSPVLLTWEENDLVYAVAGDLSSEQALMIAESLQ